MSKEIIPYEDRVIPNLTDPQIGTMNNLMAQYLIDNVMQGKNILITGGTNAGRTLLLNILAKNIPLSKKLLCMEMKPEIQLLEHDTYYLSVENVPGDKKMKDYAFITKGFPYYDEYQSIILDDVPRLAYVHLYKILLSNKQLLANLNEESNYKAINTILYGIAQIVGVEHLPKIGVGLMEKVDILVHIRRYEDDYIRIKEIAETKGFDPTTKSIVLDKMFEFATNGNTDRTGKLIGDFIKY